ncbi:MAG: hypothetical protein O3C57_04985, partial [Verrucomicrobia bacterium]|nr:hypothetical protein [Verrucomicrobiota bacterium]
MKNVLTFCSLCSAFCVAAFSLPVFAQGGGPGTEVLKKIDIQQRLNTQMPMDVKLKDSLGRTVTLGELIED